MEDVNDKIFFLSPFVWFLGIHPQQSSPIIDEVGELNNHDKDWKNTSVFLAMFSALSPSKYLSKSDQYQNSPCDFNTL